MCSTTCSSCASSPVNASAQSANAPSTVPNDTHLLLRAKGRPQPDSHSPIARALFPSSNSLVAFTRCSNCFMYSLALSRKPTIWSSIFFVYSITCKYCGSSSLSTLDIVRVLPNICPNHEGFAALGLEVEAPPPTAAPNIRRAIASTNAPRSFSVRNSDSAVELYSIGCSPHRVKNCTRCFLRFSHASPSNAVVRARSPSNSGAFGRGGITTPGYDSRNRVRSVTKSPYRRWTSNVACPSRNSLRHCKMYSLAVARVLTLKATCASRGSLATSVGAVSCIFTAPGCIFLSRRDDDARVDATDGAIARANLKRLCVGCARRARLGETRGLI